MVSPPLPVAGQPLKSPGAGTFEARTAAARKIESENVQSFFISLRLRAEAVDALPIYFNFEPLPLIIVIHIHYAQ